MAGQRCRPLPFVQVLTAVGLDDLSSDRMVGVALTGAVGASTIASVLDTDKLPGTAASRPRVSPSNGPSADPSARPTGPSARVADRVDMRAAMQLLSVRRPVAPRPPRETSVPAPTAPRPGGQASRRPPTPAPFLTLGECRQGGEPFTVIVQQVARESGVEARALAVRTLVHLPRVVGKSGRV